VKNLNFFKELPNSVLISLNVGILETGNGWMGEHSKIWENKFWTIALQMWFSIEMDTPMSY
jgi:hypothetical protein